MTKRYNNYNINNAKKPKLNEEELWDEDIDADALDKCFELASQIEIMASQARDVSILPNYSTFKNLSSITASTQVQKASASTELTLVELQTEIEKLKRQNEEKDGEIAVLRSKIKETTSCVQVEQQKTTSQWRDKLRVADKEVQSKTSELKFKNLEVANLKQQLAELRRASLNASIAPATVLEPSKSSFKTGNEKSLLAKQPILEPVYPLKSICPESFEDRIANSHMIKNVSFKISRNTIPYLQNQQTCERGNFSHTCPRLGNGKIALGNIYSEIFKMAKSTVGELNCPSMNETINKVLCVSLVILKDLNDYLIEVGSYLRTEDIQRADIDYILSEDPEICQKKENVQLGIRASKVLDVIHCLLSYNNDYTINFVCNDGSLIVGQFAKQYAKFIPHRNGAIQGDYYFLKLLLSIVKNIGINRLSRQTSAFFISVANILETIATLENEKLITPKNPCGDLLLKIFKELIIARPEHVVIKKLTFLLKIGSSQEGFCRYLFQKNDTNDLWKTSSKRVLYFKEDVCGFCILAILLQNYSANAERVPLQICFNMLNFIYNTFKTSDWMHDENGQNVCECLSKLYKLEIDFVFRGLSEFLICYKNNETDKLISDDWVEFLNHDIVQKVLNHMNFNSLEMTEKYVMVFCQYKKIEKMISKEKKWSFTQLNSSDESPSILSESFNKDF